MCGNKPNNRISAQAIVHIIVPTEVTNVDKIDLPIVKSMKSSCQSSTLREEIKSNEIWCSNRYQNETESSWHNSSQSDGIPIYILCDLYENSLHLTKIKCSFQNISFTYFVPLIVSISYYTKNFGENEYFKHIPIEAKFTTTNPTSKLKIFRFSHS